MIEKAVVEDIESACIARLIEATGARGEGIGRRAVLLAGMAALLSASWPARAEERRDAAKREVAPMDAGAAADPMTTLITTGQASIGALEALRGTVIVERDGEPAPASVGTALVKGDVVVTAEEARAVLRLGSASHIRLGGATRLRVDRYDDAGAAFTLGSGAMLYARNARGEVPEVEVAAPFGRMKGRCKRFFTGLLEAGYGVQVMQGSLTVAAGGAAVHLEPGDATVISPTGLAPEAPRPWSEARIRAALALVE